MRYEGESEAWAQLKTVIEEQVAKTTAGIEENDPFASKDAVPVPPEDRAPGKLRGAGARSPLCWKLMLVAMALIWGYSFLTMKTVLDTVPTFMLLACRFLLSAVILFIIFRKRIKAHFNREYLGFGVLMGCVIWSAYAAQTLGLVDTTPGKNAALTGPYGILVPVIALMLVTERVPTWHIASALLCRVGVGFVALDNFSIQRGDLRTLVGAVLFAVVMAVVGHIGKLIFGFVLIFLSIVLSETHFSFLRKWFPMKLMRKGARPELQRKTWTA